MAKFNIYFFIHLDYELFKCKIVLPFWDLKYVVSNKMFQDIYFSKKIKLTKHTIADFIFICWVKMFV